MVGWCHPSERLCSLRAVSLATRRLQEIRRNAAADTRAAQTQTEGLSKEALLTGSLTRKPAAEFVTQWTVWAEDAAANLLNMASPAGYSLGHQPQAQPDLLSEQTPLTRVQVQPEVSSELHLIAACGFQSLFRQAFAAHSRVQIGHATFKSNYFCWIEPMHWSPCCAGMQTAMCIPCSCHSGRLRRSCQLCNQGRT